MINSAAFTNVDGCEAQQGICRAVNADGRRQHRPCLRGLEAADVGELGKVPRS